MTRIGHGRCRDRSSARLLAPRLPALTLAVAASVFLLPARGRAVDPGSQLIPCDQADTQVTIDVSSHLDPSCTWTRGVEIVASDVVLDCQGAHIAAPDRRYGVHIVAPADVALANITVRNCFIEGFLNNVHIEREGFRDLAPGAEYEHAFSNIVIEDSTILNSRGVGVFVNAYVTGVTLRRLHVEGAGSTGIYLEAGSRDNVVEQNEIVNNGYRENGPAGQFFELGGVTFWFWGTGREGLAIDGSRNNRVANNRFSGNAAGGIFLYKNCGEFVNQRPQRWFERRYGADQNLIEGNSFVGGRYGVWVGSRMGENTLPMDCSDPQYQLGVVLDYAAQNVVRANAFQDVTFGVRVEDDRATVADNEFASADPAPEAVVVGTRYRTATLGRPVDATTITGNHAFIAGNTNPYRWVYGHTATTFAGNESLGRPAGFCEGVPPATGPFIFVADFVVADPLNPPTTEPPVLPPPDPLPPCPFACATGAPLSKASIAIRKLDTPPGDDTLVFRGRVAAPQPFVPALDPVAVGVGVVVADATGGHLLDVLVPGGAYDPETRVGWKVGLNGTRWKYVDERATPPAGITDVVVRHLWRRQAGLVQIRVVGRRGAYPVEPASLPLSGVLLLDPPTAETGQCGQTSFDGPAAHCTGDGARVICR